MILAPDINIQTYLLTPSGQEMDRACSTASEAHTEESQTMQQHLCQKWCMSTTAVTVRNHFMHDSYAVVYYSYGRLMS